MQQWKQYKNRYAYKYEYSFCKGDSNHVAKVLKELHSREEIAWFCSICNIREKVEVVTLEDGSLQVKRAYTL